MGQSNLCETERPARGVRPGHLARTPSTAASLSQAVDGERMAEACVKPGSRLATSLECDTVPTVVSGTPQSHDMGRRLRDFEFMAGQPLRTGPYPLEQWMDGSIWEIVRGEDFEGTARHMQARLHHYATHRVCTRLPRWVA